MTAGRLVNMELIFICLTFFMPVTFSVSTHDVIGCSSRASSYRFCHTLRTDTLPNLDISYNCSDPDNVTIIPPPGTNQTMPFRLFHSFLCVSSLPLNICEYPNIVSIKFDWNTLTSIPSLSCLKHLIALDLSHNQIETLRNDTFLGLTDLQYINLRFNRIRYIEPFTFKEDLLGLMTVLLDVNRLTTVEAGWLMSIKHRFGLFGLSYNEIERSSNEEQWHVDTNEKYGPGMVDLSHNKFKIWFTEQLKMYGFLDLRTLGILMEWGFDLRNNPWMCDCKMHEFLKLASNLPRVIWRDYFEVYCQSPPHLKGIQVIDVPLSELVCNITKKCPSGCFCQDQPERGQMFVDCRDGQLQHLPLDLPDGNLKLLLSNNSIKSLEARTYLARTRFIDISSNGLKYVSPEAIILLQQSVETFNLSKNDLRYLPEIIQNIQYTKLFLDNNHFVCDCKSTWMFRWLRQHEANVAGITCSIQNGDEVSVVKAEDFLQCDAVNPFPRVLSVILGTLALLFIITAVLLFVFRYEALIIMHTNIKKVLKANVIDFEHDVFVSVEEDSDTDRVWAVKTLLPELEQNHDLKLYFSLRDMDPGTIIVDETIKVLKKCHTALIVLTNDYLDNPAKVFEFSEAYKIMVRERQGRLIIVKSADVTISRQAYLNAFIRLKKYLNRDDVNLFEKVTKYVVNEKSQVKIFE